MTVENGAAKIMRAGLVSSLVFMVLGVIFSFFGIYTDGIELTLKNLLTDGAGLMYLGTFCMIGTPIAVLVYLSVYFLYKKPAKYAFYCMAMLVFLFIVILTRV
ncbi:DUF1634 domain-containing protein [Deferribacteres bacterium DY0037]